MNGIKMRLIATALAFLTIECSTYGAIVSRDMRAIGDGLLTYDDVSQREWLDVTETNHSTLFDIQKSLQPGGALFGFKIGTVDDVRSLAASAGYVGTQQYGQRYFSIATQMVDELGETSHITENGLTTGYVDVVMARISDAWATSDSGSQTVLPMIVATGTKPAVPGSIIAPGYDPTMSYVGTNYNGYPSGVDPSPYRGVWLFREVPVPEPTTISLVATLVCCLTLGALARMRDTG